MPGGVSFDRVATIYDSTRQLPAGPAVAVADALAAELGPSWSLEVGVGTGRWAFPLQQRGVHLLGVDLSRRMLTVARLKGVEHLARSDVVRLPLRDGSIVDVLSHHLLHLVYDVPSALDELARVCRGRLHSVLEFETARPNLVEAYKEKAADAGFPSEPPGLGERELSRRIRPDGRREVAVFHTRAPARISLDVLESRTYRDTWATPEPLHRALVAELRGRYADADVITETRVELVNWRCDRLVEFAAHWRRLGAAPDRDASRGSPPAPEGSSRGAKGQGVRGLGPAP